MTHAYVELFYFIIPLEARLRDQPNIGFIYGAFWRCSRVRL